MLPLVPLLLFACAPPAPPPSPLRPTPWAQTVHARLLATQRAPQPVGEGFRVWAAGRRHTLDADGLSVGALRLRVSAWGRDGEEHPVAPVAPDLAGCVSSDVVDAAGACVQRVRYDRGGMQEWWVSTDGGLEHGMDVAPPPGEAPLVVRLSGAPVARVGADEAWFDTPEGPVRYAGLVATDAAGRRLPSWMDVDDGELRLVVDDAVAVGTVTIDPVLSVDPDWSAQPLVQFGALYGFDVSGAGDVNGDGFDDVLVGAVGYDGAETGEGRAYLYLGSAAGLSTVAAWTADPTNDDRGGFGANVASAGDVDADGYDDVIIGASYFASPTLGAGKAYLYRGSAAGLSAQPVWVGEPSTDPGAQVGSVVSGAGDVNADGYDDVLVGAPRAPNAGGGSPGRVWAWLGSAAGLGASPAWTVDAGGVLVDSFGSAASPAGDVDGDGFGDVVVGSYTNFSDTPGTVMVYRGSANGLETTPWTLDEPAGVSGTRYGGSASGGGDVDGDGLDDLVVSAGFPPDGQLVSAFYLGYGAVAAPRATAVAIDAPPNAVGVLFGLYVAMVGDVNADGFDDVLTSAQRSETPDPGGRAFLYLGAAGGLSTAPAWEAAPTGDAGAHFGAALAGAGDVNGDGCADVIIGAPYAGSGGAWLYLGCPNRPEAAGNTLDEDCDGTILCYVDADGDGHAPPTDNTVLSADLACAGLAVAVVGTDDCDDADAARHPGAVETTVDLDCDGVVTCYTDEDGDGYTVVTVAAACDGPVSAPGVGPDCDDAAGDVHPGAVEAPENAVDEDCDGLVVCRVDADGDGYADASAADVLAPACEAGMVAVSSGNDCDDHNRAVYPGAYDMPHDGLDANCDGAAEHSSADTDPPVVNPDAADDGCGCDQRGGSGGWILVVLAGAWARRSHRRRVGA